MNERGAFNLPLIKLHRPATVAGPVSSRGKSRKLTESDRIVTKREVGLAHMDRDRGLLEETTCGCRIFGFDPFHNDHYEKAKACGGIPPLHLGLVQL